MVFQKLVKGYGPGMKCPACKWFSEVPAPAKVVRTAAQEVDE